MAGKTVCVTGASGFIASWLVKLLLERGYTVRGTVRNPEKSKHLLQLPGASDNLKLVAANLLEQGGFDEAVQGCDGVFHTASPYFTKNITDPQAQLIDPAVKGTLNVLASCARAQTKKVVLTSSAAAVAFTPKRTAGSFVDESWWTDVDYCEENKVFFLDLPARAAQWSRVLKDSWLMYNCNLPKLFYVSHTKEGDWNGNDFLNYSREWGFLWVGSCGIIYLRHLQKRQHGIL
jgi:nucleoside-diphosphate-sugar epimerase